MQQVAAFESESVRQEERRGRPSAMVEVDALRKRKRAIALVTIWVPTLGAVAAVALAFDTGITWLEPALLVGMYCVTMGGLEAGFHRLFSHKAFRTGPVLTFLHGVAGSMAAQGPLLYWAATHRRHHMYSDTLEDPHSPWVRKGEDGQEQRFGRLRGLWHSQMGNMYTDYPTNVMAFTRDLGKEPLLRFIDRHYRSWVLLGLLIPAGIGYAAGGTALFALKGLLWGGLLRIFVVHHVYFANGSFSHMYGARPYDTGDESTNNLWFGIPTFGSAYQNNHHAFPASAILGLRWFEIDVAAVLIRSYALLGLAHRVHHPPDPSVRARYARTPSRDKEPHHDTLAVSSDSR